MWAGYFAKNIVSFMYFQGIYNFPGKLGRVPACYLGNCLFPLWAIAYSPWWAPESAYILEDPPGQPKAPLGIPQNPFRHHFATQMRLSSS